MRTTMVVFGVLLLVVSNVCAANLEKRLALVIGNSSYRFVPKLLNPVNDAKLMADTLRGIGFSLVGDDAQIDLDKAGFERAVQNFGDQIQGAEVGLFYYAGHGIGVRGSNYLVPIGANPTREADVDFQMIDANLVLRQMEASGTRLNVVILDACRNNPFGGRGLRATSGGLAQMQAPEGTIISYATQPGNVAQDGSNGNSPFTRALTQALRKPGVDVFQTFNDVGLAVKSLTGGTQQPWLSSSPINGSFYFAGATTAQESKPASSDHLANPNPSFDARAIELSYWESVRTSESADMVQSYLEHYPNGIFAALARARIQALREIIAERGPARQPDQLARVTNPLPAPALVPRTWQQPSFECQRPGEPVALLICSDGELSEWDGRLGRAFRHKLDQAANKQETRQQERNWIEQRDATCGVPKKGSFSVAELAPLKACLLHATKERVSELEAN